MKRALGVCVLLAGCDTVFGLQRDDRGDAAIDTPAIVVSCTSTQFADSFDVAGAPCGNWGFASPDIPLQRTNGALEIPFTGSNTQGAKYGGCTADNRILTATGVIVNVEARFDGGYNVLKVRKSVDNLPNLAIVYDGATQRTESVADDSMVIASRPGPPAPWWRISAGPTGYLAWESSDGMTWQALGSATATIPTQVSIDIGAGHTTNTSSGSARIASIALCN